MAEPSFDPLPLAIPGEFGPAESSLLDSRRARRARSEAAALYLTSVLAPPLPTTAEMSRVVFSDDAPAAQHRRLVWIDDQASPDLQAPDLSA